VAKVLAADGVPVLGVNSLRYFLDPAPAPGRGRRPGRPAAATEARWGRKKIVLVGYSFGADALPAIVPLLPADLRGQIQGVVLIGTGPHGDLTFHPASWLNRRRPTPSPWPRRSRR
jgi:type IV secretory pathway VirJ component